MRKCKLLFMCCRNFLHLSEIQKSDGYMFFVVTQGFEKVFILDYSLHFRRDASTIVSEPLNFLALIQTQL